MNGESAGRSNKGTNFASPISNAANGRTMPSNALGSRFRLARHRFRVLITTVTRRAPKELGNRIRDQRHALVVVMECVKDWGEATSIDGTKQIGQIGIDTVVRTPLLRSP